MENDESANRHILVLTSIIHKRVISSTSNEKDESEVCRSSKKAIPSRSQQQHDVDEESLQRVVTKLTIEKTDITIEEINQSERSKNLNFEVFQDDNVLPSRKDISYTPRVCAICSEDYKKGDDIAWSKNEKCVHAFHTDCIVPWLMDHDDCPMCRNDYIFVENKDDDGTLSC